MKVTVKETWTVRPAVETPNRRRRLWLSNLDQLYVKIGHIPFLLPYKHDGSPDFFDVQVLKESLGKTLAAFYPVAGRLAYDGESGRFEIDCDGQGVLFAEAEIDATISEFGDFQPTQQLRPFFLEADYSNGVSSFPLLLVQVTRFRCGGVCLGVAGHHVLSDGEGITNFVITWCNLSRGLPADPNPSPFLDRTILRSRTRPPSPPLFHHPEYESTTARLHPLFLTPTEILTISTHQIKHLKHTAAGNRVLTFSNYEVVAAHLWRCVTVARRFPDPNQPTTLHISVDGRRKLRPPLPPGYFGNCVFHAQAVAPAAELVSEWMGETCGRIRRAIRRVDDEYMRSVIDHLEPPPPGVGSMTTSKFRVPGNSGSPDLKIISWTRMSFLPKDFGWGEPVFTRSANPWEGKCHILPKGENEDENVPLAVCLEPAVMERFKGLLTSVATVTATATAPPPRSLSAL